jgi:hypothetical protein
LILPEGDLGALKARIERRFAITLAYHWSEMRGGTYLRWPRTRLSLLTRMRLRLRPESPPFSELLVFSNREVDDPQPFAEGYAPDCWLVDLTGDAAGEGARWFIANEAAVTVSQ